MFQKIVLFLCCLVFVSIAQTGSIKREYWTNVNGLAINDLRSDPRFPFAPTASTSITSFEVPSNWEDNYGERVYGFISPPITGNYIFKISGDDNCELWLSTTENPGKKAKIAVVPGYTGNREWTKYSEQASTTIYLEAGKRYYIEALHKEGTQGDHMAVGWQLPNGTFEGPIPGNRLSFYSENENYSLWTDNIDVFFNTTSAGAGINEIVTGFPVLIKLNSSNFDFSTAKNNGDDIRFAKLNGNHLGYQIEHWDAVNSDASIWVLVDTIYGDNSLQKIKMYWGKPDAIGRSNSFAVFGKENGFTGVWHLSEDGNNVTGEFKDATPNVLDATGSNITNSNKTTGQIGFCQNLNGVNQKIQTTSRSVFNFATGGTVSAWVYNSTPLNVNAGIVCRGINQSVQYQNFIYKNSTGLWESRVGSQTKDYITAPINTWQYISLSELKGGKYIFYINGSPVDSGSASYGEPVDNSFELVFGLGNSLQYFNGKIDEVRWDNVKRGNSWIKLCYENQKNNQAFVSVGVPVVINAPSGLTATAIGNDIVLTWTDNSNNEDGFKIFYGTDINSLVELTSLGVDQQTYTHVVGNCNSANIYEIRAFKALKFSTGVLIGMTYTLPCVPTNLQLTDISPTELLLTWDGNAVSYRIEMNENNGAWVLAYTGAAKTCMIQGLKCNTGYDFRARAENPSGESGWTSVINRTTQACAIQTPTNLVADSTTPNQITLTWVDNADNENGYRVYRREVNDSNYTELTGSLSANTEEFIDYSVQCNKKYYYYIEAFDNNTSSGKSNIACVMTLYCGAGKLTSDMITISGMVSTDQISANSVTPALVKIYQGINGLNAIYEESFDSITVVNRYYTIYAGITADILPVLRQNNNLYYEVLMQGYTVTNGKVPLTGSAYTVKNEFNLNGNGSPIGVVDAPVGASFVDIANKKLYMKFGEQRADWVLIGN